MKLFSVLLFLCSILLYSNDYYIDDIADSFKLSKQVVINLKNNKIITTASFLEKNKNDEIMKKNSKLYKISFDVLKNIHSKFSLMKIKGVGPKVAKLLFKSGIKSLEQLKKSNLKKLQKKLIKVNKKYHYSDFVPNMENLNSWIKQIK